MTTRQVIPQMKYYADAADYNNPGSFTSMIQMKSRLETLEEKQEREKLEGEEKDKIEKLEKEKLEKDYIEQCQNMENGYAEKV